MPFLVIPKTQVKNMNIDLENFLASHPYAASTRRTYQDVLSRIFAGSQDPAKMTASELLEILDQSGWGNARQCLALAATQKYLSWKYGSAHPALSAKLKRVQGKPQPDLSPEVALRLLASFDAYTPKGARDLALCAIAIDSALRAAELCRLQTAYVDLDLCVLQVLAKGGQWMAAPFSLPTAGYISRWLNYRGEGGELLFVHIRTGEGLTPEGLNQIVRQWGLNIGIHLSPHMFRRTFATIGTLLGAPERALMEGGRWYHSDMIKRYTRNLRLEAMRPYLPVKGLLDGRLDDEV
jgi:integrase